MKGWKRFFQGASILAFLALWKMIDEIVNLLERRK